MAYHLAPNYLDAARRNRRLAAQRGIFGHTLRDGPAGPGDDFWYGPAPLAGSGPLAVTPQSALQVSAVFACVRVLAETIASLPLVLYRRKAGGGKERAIDHPLYDVLHNTPNNWQTSVDWRQQLQGYLALRGSALCEIRQGPRGAIDRLLPLHPDRVRVEQRDDGAIIAYVQPKGAAAVERVLTQEQLFRLNGLSSDGITGLSVVGVARRAFGLALSAEAHGAAFFNRGAKPAGILSHPGQLSPAARARLRANWDDMTSGIDNAGRTAVLEEGMTWQAVGMTSADAEFLATRKFMVSDICRWFRVPPHMVQDLERATFSNIEHQSIDFVVHTIRPWLVNWEQAITRDLITDPEQYVAEFLVDGLLRGDSASRVAVYNSGLANGWMTPNEVRALENLNPVDGGDELRAPLNMAPADGPPKPQDQQQQSQPGQRPAGPKPPVVPAPNRPARQVPAKSEALPDVICLPDETIGSGGLLAHPIAANGHADDVTH
jgi:HK97 family phage portal protein